ncbi:MAG: glycogen debranching protein GlgX [Candidatus Saganbacteria bacterium]|nr:glycogen debranching protein GlgX [Candidatus Saganbacteria bacterium]
MIKEGQYHPLGATIKENGVNFAIYSKHAEGIDLLLFDKPEALYPSRIISIENQTRYIWHCFVSGLKASQLYAYRVKGPYRPEEGLRFDPNCFLIDPYAKAITGKFTFEQHKPTPKCVVIDDKAFKWGKDTRPDIPMQETVIYEVHVKSFTAHPSSKVGSPGTYLGFIEKIPYLKKLGISTIELLPIQHCQDEEFLLKKGLCNYWGYSTLGFFAPDSRFSTNSSPGCQVNEFKQLVKELHKAGIEVILDVVYNHTCEGNENGPTLFFKGIDNPTYYKLSPDKRYYMDYTGCGNTLNASDPQVIKLIMDSLRYWVEEMHVDGFRFDLASALGRSGNGFEPLSAFFAVIHEDPLLSNVKMIAEPWDTSWEDYQVGNFPVDWMEWNGKYRDTIRKFVKGDAGMVPEMMLRLQGSPDLYGKSGRTPYHSINFITAHDGFTLNDLVSYAGKHNEANLEENRDGANDNLSWNWGAEGPTNDPGINCLRKQLARNFLGTLFLSEGVPMILGGDEFGRTQKGNNNTYCQDNEINYFDWTLAEKNRDLVDFVRDLIKFRESHPHFLCRSFFTGGDTNLDRLKDINWVGPNRQPIDPYDQELRSMAFLIEGSELKDNPDQKDVDIMVILNSYWEELPYTAKPCKKGETRIMIFDTAFAGGFSDKHNDKYRNISSYTIGPRSVAVFLRKQ